MSELDNEGNALRLDKPTFADRETRRRKRQLRFYLALLAIPIAVGIVILIFGRSDSQMVTDEIRKQASPVVEKEIREQIKPTIQSEVETQVSSIKPALQSEIKTQLSESLNQIDQVKTEQARLANDVNVLKSSEVKLTPEDLTTIRQSREMLNQLQKKDVHIQKLQSRIDFLERRMKVTPDPNLKVIPDKVEKQDKTIVENPIKKGPQ